MTNTEPTVTITAKEHEQLLCAALWEQALDLAGIDNWDGYEEAFEIYQDMKNDTAN